MRLLVVGLALVLAGCTDAPRASRILSDQGYSEIQITSYRWFMCGEGDFYHTGFTAKGPTGKPVSGVVCSGLLFKGGTVRFD